VARVRCWRSEGLEELDAIAEGVVNEDPCAAVDRAVFTERVARRSKLLRERAQPRHDQTGMRLTSGTELRIDAQMDLELPALEPTPTPLGKIRRLRHLRNAEDPLIEVACPGLTARGHRKLDMIDSGDRHRRGLLARGSSDPQRCFQRNIAKTTPGRLS